MLQLWYRYSHVYIVIGHNIQRSLVVCLRSFVQHLLQAQCLPANNTTAAVKPFSPSYFGDPESLKMNRPADLPSAAR